MEKWVEFKFNPFFIESDKSVVFVMTLELLKRF